MPIRKRCGECKKFKGNGIKCPSDAFKRGKLYANDYACVDMEE